MNSISLEEMLYANMNKERVAVLKEKKSMQRPGAVQISVVSTSCSCKQTAIKAIKPSICLVPLTMRLVRQL